MGRFLYLAALNSIAKLHSIANHKFGTIEEMEFEVSNKLVAFEQEALKNKAMTKKTE